LAGLLAPRRPGFEWVAGASGPRWAVMVRGRGFPLGYFVARTWDLSDVFGPTTVDTIEAAIPTR